LAPLIFTTLIAAIVFVPLALAAHQIARQGDATFAWAVEMVRKRVPVNKGEQAEAVAEIAVNEFYGQNMRPGDVRRHS
jgi:hypothetical protein